MSKIIAPIAAIALVVAAVVPVFAYGSYSYSRPSIDLSLNYASVNTSSSVLANSGQNFQGNAVETAVAPANTMTFGYHQMPCNLCSNTVVTGNNNLTTGSVRATSTTNVYANLNEGMMMTRSYRPQSGSSFDINIDLAKVNSTSSVEGNSGVNQQGNYATAGNGNTFVSGHNNMTTGNVTATSDTMVVVNSDWHMN